MQVCDVRVTWPFTWNEKNIDLPETDIYVILLTCVNFFAVVWCWFQICSFWSECNSSSAIVAFSSLSLPKIPLQNVFQICTFWENGKGALVTCQKSIIENCRDIPQTLRFAIKEIGLRSLVPRNHLRYSHYQMCWIWKIVSGWRKLKNLFMRGYHPQTLKSAKWNKVGQHNVEQIQFWEVWSKYDWL